MYCICIYLPLLCFSSAWLPVLYSKVQRDEIPDELIIYIPQRISLQCLHTLQKEFVQFVTRPCRVKRLNRAVLSQDKLSEYKDVLNAQYINHDFIV